MRHNGRRAWRKVRVIVLQVRQSHRLGPYTSVPTSLGSGCAGYDGPFLTETDSQYTVGVNPLCDENIAGRVGPLLTEPSIIEAGSLSVRMAFYSQSPARMGFQPIDPLVNHHPLIVLDRCAVEPKEYPVSFTEVRNRHGDPYRRGDPGFRGDCQYIGR